MDTLRYCKRTLTSRSNKGPFIGARQATYEIYWQLLTSWPQRIKQAKRNTQDQQAFCSAELALSGVEVDNPGDKHLLSIRYKSEHAQMQINADNINTQYNHFFLNTQSITVDMKFISYYTAPKIWEFCLLVNVGHLHPGLMSHDDSHTVQQPPMQQRLRAFERQWLHLSYSWFWVYLRSAWLCDLQPLIWTPAGSNDTIQW